MDVCLFFSCIAHTYMIIMLASFHHTHRTWCAAFHFVWHADDACNTAKHNTWIPHHTQLRIYQNEGNIFIFHIQYAICNDFGGTIHSEMRKYHTYFFRMCGQNIDCNSDEADELKRHRIYIFMHKMWPRMVRYDTGASSSTSLAEARAQSRHHCRSGKIDFCTETCNEHRCIKCIWSGLMAVGWGKSANRRKCLTSRPCCGGDGRRSLVGQTIDFPVGCPATPHSCGQRTRDWCKSMIGVINLAVRNEFHDYIFEYASDQSFVHRRRQTSPLHTTAVIDHFLSLSALLAQNLIIIRKW